MGLRWAGQLAGDSGGCWDRGPEGSPFLGAAISALSGPSPGGRQVQLKSEPEVVLVGQGIRDPKLS